MPGITIAVIEGDETEISIIRDEVLSEFQIGDLTTFESVDVFIDEHSDQTEYDLIIADLLEQYDPEMSDESVYNQLSENFTHLLSNINEDGAYVTFLTKVPSNYVRKGMKRSVNVFPDDTDGIDEKFKSKQPIMYNAKTISIVSKPYILDDDTGELLEIIKDQYEDVTDHLANKLEVPLKR